MTDAPQKVLFVDRDGTLIEEPPDEQVDSLAKVRWLPDVFASLQQLVAAGYRVFLISAVTHEGLSELKFAMAQAVAAEFDSQFPRVDWRATVAKIRSDAPFEKVSFTTCLYVSPVQTMPSCSHTGTPRHFQVSTTAGSASWITRRMRASIRGRSTNRIAASTAITSS